MKKRSFPYSNPKGTSAMETKKRRRKRRCVKFITEELITDIITRLPVKDLMRSTCVSKSWCSLIRTDPYFHRLQLHRYASPSDPPLLLAGREVKSTSGSCSWSFYYYLADLDSSSNLIEVHNPFRDNHAFVIGSCQGLLVFQEQRSHKMAVSNPITRKHRMLPPNPADDGDGDVEFCGFGYDRVHDCYKLVTKAITQRELTIYDLKSDQWYSRPSPVLERMEFVPSLDHSRMKCADGGVYWCLVRNTGDLGCQREMKSMMCFVLAEEEFHEVETPYFGEVKYHPNLTVLDGRLGLVMEELDGERHEVWMIDMECDSNETYSWRWTKIMSLSCPKAMLPSPYNLEEKLGMIPVCFSACKTKLLYVVQRKDLFWYDMVNKEFHKLSDALLNGVDEYFESFVPTLVGTRYFEVSS